MIFENVHARNAAADNDPECIRISIDTKATIYVGEYSRNGSSRALTPVKALDHDMATKQKLVPVGVLEPKMGLSFVAFGNDNKTSDLIADGIESWYSMNRDRIKAAGIRKLVVNSDNGPESNSHRSQFMLRMVELADRTGLEIHMVYYPPYHSKYNPIEHYWGGLERSWNGSLLDCIETVFERTLNFCWRKTKTCAVKLFGEYAKGVVLKKADQKRLEQRLIRSKTIPRWDVVIMPLLVN